MKSINIALLIILFNAISCKNTKHEDVIFQYKYFGHFGGNYKCNVEIIEHPLWHSISDSIVLMTQFELNGTGHQIRTFNNYSSSHSDNERFLIELDNLGVIFKSNLTWNSYVKMISDNDSINEIIDMAINLILINNEQSIFKSVNFR